MAPDAALNLVWVAMGVAALAGLGFSELRHRGSTTLGARCRRGIAVLIATVALFPCISASDDLVCLQRLQVGSRATAVVRSPSQEKSNQRPFGYLALLLEGLENFQVSPPSALVATPCFSALVLPLTSPRFERPLPSRAGRAPPRLAFLG